MIWILAPLLFALVHAVSLHVTPSTITVGDVFLVEWQRDAGDPNQFVLHSVGESGGVGFPLGIVVSNNGSGFSLSGSQTHTATTPGLWKAVAFTDDDGSFELASSNQVTVLAESQTTSQATSQTTSRTTVSTTNSQTDKSISSPASSPTSQSKSNTSSSTTSSVSGSGPSDTPGSQITSSAGADISSTSSMSWSTVSSTSPPTNDDSAADSKPGNGVQTGLIVGVILAVLAVISLATLVIMVYRRRRKLRDSTFEPFVLPVSSGQVIDPARARMLATVDHPTTPQSSPLFTASSHLRGYKTRPESRQNSSDTPTVGQEEEPDSRYLSGVSEPPPLYSQRP